MKRFKQYQSHFEQKIEHLQHYLQALSARERVLVIFTTIFLLVVFVVTALWKMHSLAEQQQQRLNTLKDITVWMQDHAATMKPSNDLTLSTMEKVQRTAQQQSLNVAAQQNGEQTQLSVEHQNYAVLANFLMQLSQMGISIQKMNMVSNNNQIKLTATVQ